MHSHDIEEVCKLKLSNTMEDTIAWHYERSGIFSVCSACRLALKIDQEEERAVGVHGQMVVGGCTMKSGQLRFHQRCGFLHGAYLRRDYPHSATGDVES
jgi:hypothetical protein